MDAETISFYTEEWAGVLKEAKERQTRLANLPVPKGPEDLRAATQDFRQRMAAILDRIAQMAADSIELYALITIDQEQMRAGRLKPSEHVLGLLAQINYNKTMTGTMLEVLNLSQAPLAKGRQS
jgi:hypothetical protein